MKKIASWKGEKKIMITRRQFLRFSAIAGAAAVVPWKMAVREAYAQYGVNSPSLQKFVAPMRGIGGTGFPVGIPVATPDAAAAPVTGVTHYTINIQQFTDQLHPNLPAPGTKLWGFNPAPNGVTNPSPRHLGGIVVATRNAPLQFTFRNNLPPTNIIPVDTTIPGANQAQNRVAVHIHGGLVPWISDGGPFDWWAPDGTHGASFLNNVALNPGAAANEAEYYYPNNQSARLLWYHDHAFGITRTNAYAGIASGYVINDPAADAAMAAQGLPGDLDPRTHYLIFQDKIFLPQPIPANYPIAGAVPGDLAYAWIYDPLLFGPAGVPSFPPPNAALTPFPVPSVIPEFFGDTILVNGTVYPFLEVEPRVYRFKLLNACNSRFLNPRFVRAQNNRVGSIGSTEADGGRPVPSIVIGNEAGFLPAPAVVRGRGSSKLVMGPAERADIIVDFTNAAPGSIFILYNDAPGPFPGGARIFDYHPKNSMTPISTPGFGPNTRTLLQVRVKAPVGPATPALPATINLTGLGEPPLVTQTPGVPTPIPTSVVVGGQTFPVGLPRQLTLNEGFDDWGRLGQFLGTNAPTVPGFFGREYLDTTTEVVPAGTVEVWQIANLTADTHPIHFHLVNVQILSRQAFSVKTYNGTPAYMGPLVAPEDYELGYKETVQMHPGEVTTVIMKFDLPVVPFTVPVSPRTGGNEYVWHCHILEHEEHDMMRPLVVV